MSKAKVVTKPKPTPASTPTVTITPAPAPNLRDQLSTSFALGLATFMREMPLASALFNRKPADAITPTTPKTRALNMSRIYEQVSSLLMERSDSYPWIVDFYHEGAELFCITAEKGRLYRYDVGLDENDKVALGDPILVMQKFVESDEDEDADSTGDNTPTPAMDDQEDARADLNTRPRNRTWIIRQANGRVRWFSISCTNVLNRSGEIDSAELFDSFIAHATKTGEYPIRVLYHLGEVWRTGQADLLARDEHCYITSGEFDDTMLGELEVKAREADPDFYGESIGYTPTAKPRMVEVAPDVRIPVYSAGINREISTLPEDDAAALFTVTAQTEVQRMKPKVKSAILDMAKKAGMVEEVTEFIDQVDSTNRSIKRDNLVTRAKGGKGKAGGKGGKTTTTATTPKPTGKTPVKPAPKNRADKPAGEIDPDADELEDDDELVAVDDTELEDVEIDEGDEGDEADDLEEGDEDEEDDEDQADDEGDELDDDEAERTNDPDAVEFDDEAIGQLAEAIVAHPNFERALDAILERRIAEEVTARETFTTELDERLEEFESQVARQLEALSHDDTERVNEIARDLPARTIRVGVARRNGNGRTGATYRPREVARDQHDDPDDLEPPSLDELAEQTLNEIQEAQG